MTSLWFSRRALADLERFSEFLLEQEPANATSTMEGILNGVEILRRHPHVGRPVGHGLRELVISRGRSGYVALYAFDAVRDEITVHKLRHQLEAGDPDDGP